MFDHFKRHRAQRAQRVHRVKRLRRLPCDVIVWASVVTCVVEFVNAPFQATSCSEFATACYSTQSRQIIWRYHPITSEQ